MQTNTTSRQSIVIKLIGLIIFFTSGNAFGQLIPISLDQRIDSSSTIFEGKVMSKTSFWDEGHTHIYTSNIVSVYKVFKGNLAAPQVEIITRGGIVGNNMEQVSHTLELSEGDVGIFTAMPNTAKLSSASSLIRLKAYSGIQGFIKYDFKNGSAKDPFRTYYSIAGEVYSSITKRTKSDFIVIKKADFTIN